MNHPRNPGAMNPTRSPQYMNATDVQVITNVFEVTRLPNVKYWLYDAFNPDIEKKSWRKRSDLVRHLQYKAYAHDFPVPFLFDGGAVGFAHERLQNGLGALRTFRVRLRDNGPPDANARSVYEVTFKKAGAGGAGAGGAGAGGPIIINPTQAILFIVFNKVVETDRVLYSDLNNLVVKNEAFNGRISLINFLQLVIRQDSNNLHPNNGKAYFAAETKEIAGSFLEFKRGIFHSVRPAIHRMTVVVDTVVAPFLRPGPLIESALAFLSRGDRNMNNIRTLERVDNSDLVALKRVFKGTFIREKKGNPPREGNRRKIQGFIFTGGLYQFENDEGTMITVAEHYRRVHAMTVRYPRIPGVVLKERPTLEVVPMEYCYVEPNQIYRKTLRENDTRAMVEFSTLLPRDKLKRIHDAREYYQNSETLRHAGMEVAPRTITAQGRLFSPPQIVFRNGPISINDGKWNVLNKKLFRTVGKCEWGLINLEPMRIRSPSLHIRELQTNARNLGIPLEDPLHFSKINPQTGDVLQDLDRFMVEVRANFMAKIEPDMERKRIEKKMTVEQKEEEKQNHYKAMLQANGFFLLIILPKEAASLKAAIKHWGDALKGIPTQCVREDKISKFENPNNRQGASSQYWNNVLLKINSRMGGENSRIAGSGTIEHLAKKGKVTMFVGSDVSHPGPGVRKPSVASLVYNQDQLGIKYTAITRLQDPRVEVMVDLEDMFRGAVLDLMGIAHGPVTDIIFYRDGVSEGEYDDIIKHEIGAIERAIDTVWSTHDKLKDGGFKKPNLSFIVVGKRHHTLLFPGSPHLSDQKGNCKAGVVVDRDINQPLITDFYLQSHAGLIGTSRSSHYIVLKNDVFSNDTRALQEVSYALCHVYAKATRSVSMPAPVYYADLACGRGTFHYAPSVEENLRAQDSESISSGGSNVPFDMRPWLEAFKARHSHLKGNMYFL